MLPILVLVLLASSAHVDAQAQAISLGQSFVSLLNSFCHYMGQQGQDFVCTCVTEGATQALSSSLDQFCEFMSDRADEYKCRCVFRPGGGPPYPVAPGFEQSQRQPSIVFLQQQNGRPIFVNAPPQQNTGPIIINQGGQPQAQPAQNNDGKPIIIQLQPSPVTVLNNGNNGPKIGAQSKDQPEAPAPPAAPAAPAAPATTAAPDLTSLVFVGEGAAMITRCPVGTPNSWIYHTWMEGHIRPYYENVGLRATLEECKQTCEARDDCFFATFTASRTCFILTTTHTDKCSYHLGGHHGRLGEACTPQRPCASAYKRCGKPNCTLQSIINIFCTTQNKLRAVTSCKST